MVAGDGGGSDGPAVLLSLVNFLAQALSRARPSSGRPRSRYMEEEQGVVTPISRSGTASGPDHDESSTSPVSGGDGFSSIATDPNDDSRPITKKELTRFRRVVVKTFQTMNSDLMNLLNAESRSEPPTRGAQSPPRLEDLHPQ